MHTHTRTHAHTHTHTHTHKYKHTFRHMNTQHRWTLSSLQILGSRCSLRSCHLQQLIGTRSNTLHTLALANCTYITPALFNFLAANHSKSLQHLRCVVCVCVRVCVFMCVYHRTPAFEHLQVTPMLCTHAVIYTGTHAVWFTDAPMLYGLQMHPCCMVYRGTHAAWFTDAPMLYGLQMQPCAVWFTDAPMCCMVYKCTHAVWFIGTTRL